MFQTERARAQGSGFGGGLLRVCADPDNMPFSNDKGQGFENKLAELIAGKLDAKISYVWFPEGSGLVPNTMGNESCDIVMGYAQGTGLIEDTNPYYYTSYALVFRKGDASLAGVNDLSDKRLLDKKIGIVAGTPPVSIMAINGLAANAKPFGAGAVPGATDPVAEIIAKIASGELDAGILWGPLAGYFAQRSKVPLEVEPLVKEKLGPAHALRHHARHSAQCAGMEAYDQQADRGEPARDQRHLAGLRHAPARCGGSSGEARHG